MNEYHALVLARALHVFGVVLWIGGVAFVTTVLLPALKRHEPSGRMALFEALEGRFALQAKLTTLLTGLSGFYMLYALDGWSRYLSPQFWWLHLMTLIWLLFSLILFVFEPLFLHRWFHQQAQRDSDGTFRNLQRMHSLLLSLSLLAVLGAVAGSHGLMFGG
ncbi:hypothetical protein [Marinobacterium arenosum]|uniref:hypothetical protein n=1 Tax=Marinobacterium arenosum TaxID=2862496 RepID=UPI001C93DA3E|nr:hypothetical protein [Marinobacterium arenosum]MBY4678774.1 hypothetical protein [Marinobacterium arenosum]